MSFGRLSAPDQSPQRADRSRNRRKTWRIAAVALAAGVLAACQADEFGGIPKHKRPVSESLKRKIGELNMMATSPIMIRIFKEESELEVWKQTRTGKYKLLEEFEICKWSGELGPKFKEGDRQAPEGFYQITPALMNPNSSYHLSFNLGFPNRYDQAHNRTGSHLMVHGACSSRGCYAMTDDQVQDIYGLARDSFKGGQRSFQVQAFPFRMTPENMARHRGSEHMDFWRMLKTGYDHFEVTGLPPNISVCEKKYVFDATTLVEGVPFRATAQCPDYEVDPRIAMAVAAKQNRDEEKFQQIAARIDAREVRQQRWEERQERIAEALSFGNGAEARTARAETPEALPGGLPEPAATAAADAPAPVPVPAPSVETAYTGDGSGSGNPAIGFFKRWVPFGPKTAEAEAESAPVSVDAVPAPRP